MDDYESLSHSKWECKYHVVFIPKGRRKTLYENSVTTIRRQGVLTRHPRRSCEGSDPRSRSATIAIDGAGISRLRRGNSYVTPRMMLARRRRGSDDGRKEQGS